jgi:hypothetical protein
VVEVGAHTSTRITAAALAKPGIARTGYTEAGNSGGCTMIDDTIAKIEQAILRAGEAHPSQREELIRLLEQLREEVRALPASEADRARSIAHFAQAAAHEAARRETSPRLLELSGEGLKESVAGFEGAHPELISVVNKISSLLSSIGI